MWTLRILLFSATSIILLSLVSATGISIQANKNRVQILRWRLEGAPFQERLGAGKLLVASRNIKDPNFSKTVVLLIVDDWHGSIGVVINRPSRVSLAEALPKLKVPKELKDILFIGGPLSRLKLLLLIRSKESRDETEHVVEDIYVSGSPVVLERLVADNNILFRAYLGYAGWAPRQLEAEVGRGDWQILPADSNIVFKKASKTIWSDLIQKDGSDWVWEPDLFARKSDSSVSLLSRRLNKGLAGGEGSPQTKFGQVKEDPLNWPGPIF